jgi:hypothetical protein
MIQSKGRPKEGDNISGEYWVVKRGNWGDVVVKVLDRKIACEELIYF